MDYEESPPQVVVLRTVDHTSQTVKEALIKGILAGVCSFVTFLTIRQVKKMDAAKEELKKKKLAEATKTT